MYSLASVMPGNSGDSAAGVIGRWKISFRGLRCCCEKRQREASGSFSRTLLFIYVLLHLEQSARARTVGGSTCQRRVGPYPSSRGPLAFSAGGSLPLGVFLPPISAKLWE
jgi:hypothetical protein